MEPVDGHAPGNRAIAILLATAAVVAAIIGARATFVASDSSSNWQSALRTEVQRSANALADIRFLYQAEVPIAVQVLRARTLQSTLQAAAASADGVTAQALTLEAGVQAGVISAIASSSDLATKPAYALPSGGLNLGKRLADLRAESPRMLALDPDSLQAAGDRQSQKSQLLTLAELPVGIAALLGVLAEPFLRRRRSLLAGGVIALAIGGLVALGVEALT
jgi:hypothetical protein